MQLPERVVMNVVESSLPPGLPLPRYRELRYRHAPAVRAQGRLLMMIAAASEFRAGFKYGRED